MATERTALHLTYDPDTYMCTWTVPDQAGGYVDVPGDLDLRPDRPPRGSIYGRVPLAYERGPGRQIAASFPQTVEEPAIRGTLANGGTVLLLDAHVEYWLPGSGHVSGSAALLGKGDSFFNWGTPVITPAPLIAAPTFTSVTFQITGLDALLGTKPIGTTFVPVERPRDSPGEWRAIVNSDADGEWSSDGVTLTVGYDGRAHAADGYNFELAFSPVGRLAFVEGVTLRTAVDEYVQPLRRIASIATGTPQHLTYLAVAASEPNEDRGGPESGNETSQVFGTGITQEPYESSRDAVKKAASALRAKLDHVSLLELALRWGQLAADHHPLIETYGAMVHVTDRHPRSRILLLLQALEGMNGYETKDDTEQRTARHLARREKVLSRAAQTLGVDDVSFFKHFLSKRPSENLESAIIAAVRGLPVDTMNQLAGTALVQETIAEEPTATTPANALRIVRNNLAHGTRGYDTRALDEVATVLERVVRAHALRILGCPSVVQARALDAS